jgi:type II secretory pathway component PulF
LTRFAETLAGHLEAGVPLPEGLRMAAAAWENNALEQAALAHAAALASGQTPNEHSPFAAALPPLLRWAIWHADEHVDKAWALRMAAGAYRESAERRVGRLQILAPIVACVLIGGGVVLLYALALFVPVVQMLHGLAG